MEKILCVIITVLIAIGLISIVFKWASSKLKKINDDFNKIINSESYKLEFISIINKIINEEEEDLKTDGDDYYNTLRFDEFYDLVLDRSINEIVDFIFKELHINNLTISNLYSDKDVDNIVNKISIYVKDLFKTTGYEEVLRNTYNRAISFLNSETLEYLSEKNKKETDLTKSIEDFYV